MRNLVEDSCQQVKSHRDSQFLQNNESKILTSKSSNMI